jgi:amino-acid N-acetyltransferase
MSTAVKTLSTTANFASRSLTPKVKNLRLRAATTADAEAIHALVVSHKEEGHLLPRELGELRMHADRFVVAENAGKLVACAELAPLSESVAEVRSLVVSRDYRGRGLAGQMVDELRIHGRAAGFDTLTAFTHDTRFFAREGFSVVPHIRVPEKVMRDCVSCPLFGNCDQYAMVLPLHDVVDMAAAPDAAVSAHSAAL